jgi:biopolymer transport protein ExbD
MRSTRRSFSWGLAGMLVAGVARAQTGADMNVVIDALGHVSIDGRAVNDTAIVQAASTFVARVGTGARARIAADARASHAVVVHVMDQLRAGGIERFAIAVAPSDPPAGS